KEMVTRDANHPSIIMWANGNEGGNNFALDDEFGKYDLQNRQVIHPWDLFRDINTFHYISYDYGVGTAFQGNDIFFPTEFLHGMYDGGGGAGLDDYWTRMNLNPIAAGGFIWCLVDEGVVRTDLGDSLDTKLGRAPDGVLGPYREKEASYYTVKEIFSPVHVNKKYIGKDFDGILEIQNEYFFTNLITCSFERKLLDFPGPGDNDYSPVRVDAKRLKSPVIEPGQKGLLDLELPSDWKNKDALYLTAYDKFGNEIFTWSWYIKTPTEKLVEVLPTTLKKGNVRKTEKDSSLYLQIDEMTYSFHKGTGRLNYVINKIDTIPFGNGPILEEANLIFDTLIHYENDSGYTIEVSYKKEDTYFKYRWNLLESNWLVLDYAYRVRGKFDNMGINFDLPEEYAKGITWMGRGPYRVWKNRLKGQRFGVWRKDYNDGITGENWIYPEFKGYHSEFFWGKIENDAHPITVISGKEGLFLRLFTPTKPKDDYSPHIAPKFPGGNISFLHAINAIGSKFAPPCEKGPQGSKNLYFPGKGYQLEGLLYFNFNKY
ncbi:MAG: glycoside hydrolase family 2 TIM barrel-domain containing protein, partial [bacterium]